MAALTITAASVTLVSGSVEVGQAGEALTRGVAIYKKASDGKWYKADCNHATAENRNARAIAMSDIQADGYFTFAQGQCQIGFGAILTVGEMYFLDATAGQIIPDADLASGYYVNLLGIAISTSTMQMYFLYPSAVLA